MLQPEQVLHRFRILMSSPQLLAKTDQEMINYFKCILQTVTGAGQGDAVKRS